MLRSTAAGSFSTEIVYNVSVKPVCQLQQESTGCQAAFALSKRPIRAPIYKRSIRSSIYVGSVLGGLGVKGGNLSGYLIWPPGAKTVKYIFFRQVTVTGWDITMIIYSMSCFFYGTCHSFCFLVLCFHAH
jgi:hypothetical protein